MAITTFGLISTTPADVAPEHSQDGEAKLLLTENAYNPIPSPNGRMVAFVATGWGWAMGAHGSGGTGRSNLVSSVGLMDSSGKVVNHSLAPDEFLTGWSSESKSVICYRDWHYSVVTTAGLTSMAGELPKQWGGPEPAEERVVYLNDIQRPVWLQREGPDFILTSGAGVVMRLGDLPWGALVTAPSPDGRYLAIVVNSPPNPRLRIYDRQLDQSVDLGEATVSPDRDWDYMKPAWDPWFADSSRLVFSTGSNLVICSPDGTTRRTVSIGDRSVGLATPSPNGESIAYVSFENRAMASIPDLKYWGNTAVWTISTSDGLTPHQQTRVDPDTTLDLRWLGNKELVFDRVGENLFKMHARIWEVAVR